VCLVSSQTVQPTWHYNVTGSTLPYYSSGRYFLTPTNDGFMTGSQQWGNIYFYAFNSESSSVPSLKWNFTIDTNYGVDLSFGYTNSGRFYVKWSFQPPRNFSWIYVWEMKSGSLLWNSTGIIPANNWIAGCWVNELTPGGDYFLIGNSKSFSGKFNIQVLDGNDGHHITNLTFQDEQQCHINYFSENVMGVGISPYYDIFDLKSMTNRFEKQMTSQTWPSTAWTLKCSRPIVGIQNPFVLPSEITFYEWIDPNLNLVSKYTSQSWQIPHYSVVTDRTVSTKDCQTAAILLWDLDTQKNLYNFWLYIINPVAGTVTSAQPLLLINNVTGYMAVTALKFTQNEQWLVAAVILSTVSANQGTKIYFFDRSNLNSLVPKYVLELDVVVLDILDYDFSVYGGIVVRTPLTVALYPLPFSLMK